MATQNYGPTHRTVFPFVTAYYGVPLSRVEQEELQQIGANLRRERSAQKITQERLAELADLNIRTIQKIESGQMNILITTVLRIHRALKCPWERLLH